MWCALSQQAATWLSFRPQFFRTTNVHELDRQSAKFYGVITHSEMQGPHFGSKVHAGHRKIYLENFISLKTRSGNIFHQADLGECIQQLT